MNTIEVRVRAFFTSDEAEVVPSTMVTVDLADISKLPWAKIIRKLARDVCAQAEGVPFTNVRPMTPDEIESYLAEEDADEQ